MTMYALGEVVQELLTVLYQGSPSLVPGAIFTASKATRVRQVVCWTPGDKPAQVSLQLVRSGSGGQPGGVRSEILADKLPIAPHGVVELVHPTTGGSGYLTLWPRDMLYGEQETEPGVTLLCYGISDA